MSSDLQQLFDKHHNADLLYREVCTLKLQLATVQQNGADTGSPTPQLPDFLETAFGSTQLGNPVSGDVCVTRLLAVVQAPQIQLDTVKSLLKVIKHQQPEKWPDVVSRIIKIAVGILDGVTRGLLDKHISKETLLLPTDILHNETEVPPICFKKFCTHTVSVITSHRPNMKVSEALKRQTEWKSGKIPHSLKAFFKQTGEVLEMLRRILEKQEVNWQMVLSCLATFLVCFQQASASIQEHVRRLLAESLESGDMENTIVGFLMARQSCTEGAHIFPTYQQWFQDVFGDGARSPAGKKKSFTFLMKFLTDLVPFEPAEVLKVHILKPPFVPAKCRDLLTDYVILVPLEEPSTAIYSDQSRTHSEDVEKALAVFESTGKLPTTVMEASIFRKPYFVGRFLPALLQPRHLPDVPDTRMRFIDSLKRAGKIPSSLYTKYEEACRRETKQLLEGVFEMGEEDDVDDMLLEPMEQLSHRLRQLTETVCSQSPQNRVSELISVISEKMVDELLNCVCRTLHASRSVGHQMWLQQLVRMLSQHTAIHTAFFTRLLQLIVSKDCGLADHHIDGLAAVTLQVSMDQQEQQFPSLSVKGHDGDSNVPDGTFLLLLLHCLANRNAGEMRHSLRFLSATLKLLFLHHDDCISAKAQDFIPRQFFVTFCLLVWRLFPELRPAQGLSHFDLKHKLDVPSAEDDTDMMDFVDNVAKALYISEKFQGFVKTQKRLVQNLPADTQSSPDSVPWLLQQVSQLISASQSGKDIVPEAVLRVVFSLPAYLLFTDTLGGSLTVSQNQVRSAVLFIDEVVGFFTAGDHSENQSKSDLSAVERHPVLLLSALAVVILSEILLASLSSPELCHQELSRQMDVEMKLLTEMWLQRPELMQTVGQPRGAEFSMHAGFADRRPFMDLAVLRCLSLLPTDVVAAEGGVLEAAMRTYARLCQRFEDTAASGQVADVEIMLHLSKSLHQLVRVAPLAVVRTLDPENIKRCGLEIFRLQQQRMKNSM
ncbi:hypothetical protein BaRGS_00011086 [Batillaria attramentaria]|uniref:Fanconi anemia group A protein n=1 Tax=Batillaria attramentaria TaxID=370345 RepID=A0ABD0LED1_9CAEN